MPMPEWPRQAGARARDAILSTVDSSYVWNTSGTRRSDINADAAPMEVGMSLPREVSP
ncbi:hypothetical protein GCM10022247_35800 [Allokutzneria multivorans]|uniref:Uncharacterized protein n=1 Tax=Allokutzneria multivorans TaxID=1142134 RepID=A0ABP7SE25_9PSEU